MPNSSPSVLIIRLDAIGDALALTPLVAALRAVGARVDLVLSGENAGAFAPNAVGTVYVAPFGLRDDAAANRSAIERFGIALRGRYSDVLVATEDLSGYRLAAAVNSPRRVGFHNGWGKPVKTLLVRRLLTDAQYRTAGLDARAPHECEVLFALGAALLPAQRPSCDAAVLAPLVTSRTVPDARVAIQVTNKFQRMGIVAGDVATLIRCIARARPVHLLAAARESAYAEQFAALGQLSIYGDVSDWKAAVAGAPAMVAPDSGAIHVSGMTGVPTVAVFPAQRHVERQIARWHPWAAPYRAVVSHAGWHERAAAALDELLPV